MKRIFSLSTDLILLALLLSLLHGVVACLSIPHAIILAKWDTIILLILGCFIFKFYFQLTDGVLRLLHCLPGFDYLQKIEAYLAQIFKNKKMDITLLMGSIIFSLVIVEISLRLLISSLPYELGNYLSGSYMSQSSGIYYFDQSRNMYRMKANYERWMYMYGYWWHHKTDALGYRNSEKIDQAEIAILGDSFVYGQAVSENQTIAHHLKMLLEKPVANLGQQAAAIDYEYQILIHDSLKYHPHKIILFHFSNDIDDLVKRLKEDEMQRFLHSDSKDYFYPYFDVRPEKKSLRILNSFEESLQNVYVIRAYQYAVKKMSAKNQSSLQQSSPSQENLTQQKDQVSPNSLQETSAHTAEFSLALRFHMKMLERMKEFTDEHGIELYHVTIDASSEQVEQALAKTCFELNIPYFNFSPVIKQHQNGEANALLLPGDGHLNNDGSLLLAQSLSEYFKLLSHQQHPH